MILRPIVQTFGDSDSGNAPSDHLEGIALQLSCSYLNAEFTPDGTELNLGPRLGSGVPPFGRSGSVHPPGGWGFDGLSPMLSCLGGGQFD